MRTSIRGKVLSSINVVVIRTALIIATILLSSSDLLLAEDLGAPDSVILEMRIEGEITNPQRFVLDLFVFNDSNNLASVSMNFSWDNPNIQMDSAKPTILAVEAFNFNQGNPQLGSHFISAEIANEHKILTFVGARFWGDGLVMSPERQLLGSVYFSVTNWSSPDCVCFDTSTIGPNSGVIFVDGSNQAYEPIWTGSACLFTGEDSDGDGVGNACQFCCIGTVGNIDCDSQEIVDIADLTALIDHLFVTLEPLCCTGEGNIDSDPLGETGLADLTMLIDHLFISRTAVGNCR